MCCAAETLQFLISYYSVVPIMKNKMKFRSNRSACLQLVNPGNALGCPFQFAQQGPSLTLLALARMRILTTH